MNVLIATVTAGAGHIQAASALEEAWKSLRPRDNVQKLDVLDFTTRLYRKMYVESYVKLVEHAPDLWAHVFKKTDNPEFVKKLKGFRRAWLNLTSQKFIKQLKKFRPDILFGTHYLPLEIMSAVRSEHTPAEVTPLTVSVVTDFEAHALWMQPGVDLYSVAAEQTKARLVARGAKSENVLVTGIPIAGKFSKPVDELAVRRQLGLRDDVPVLLVLGGGFGMGPVEEILTQLNQVDELLQVVVVCGRNDDLRRNIAVMNHRHPTDVLGFVTNMHELMAVSELILTKPGGLTSSEALAMGKPLLIVNPIPGQEAANSDFLLEHGAALKVNRVEDLPYRLRNLLTGDKLKEMAKAARALGRPDAALTLCKQLFSIKSAG